MAKKNKQAENTKKAISNIYVYIFIAFVAWVLGFIPYVTWITPIALLVACYELGRLNKTFL